MHSTDLCHPFIKLDVLPYAFFVYRGVQVVDDFGTGTDDAV